VKAQSNYKTGTISTRVSKSTETFFKNNKLKGSGAISALVLDSFHEIYASTVIRLKLDFKKDFLISLVKSQNGEKIDPENIQFVSTLSLADSFIINLWANAFWYGDNEIEDIEEYIK